MNFDSLPNDIIQAIIKELSLPDTKSFASTRKSHALAMYERIAQMEQEEEAAAAEEYAEEEAKWFPNGDGNIADDEPGSDWSEEEF
tara:strand:+ start:287 stop:544 length:258 start_codon:yes stop_codon:yes gene_type:complete